jgi:hypothetical protein
MSHNKQIKNGTNLPPLSPPLSGGRLLASGSSSRIPSPNLPFALSEMCLAPPLLRGGWDGLIFVLQQGILNETSTR